MRLADLLPIHLTWKLCNYERIGNMQNRVTFSIIYHIQVYNGLHYWITSLFTPRPSPLCANVHQVSSDLL